MTLPDELNEDLKQILGKPCFEFIGLAHLFRLNGKLIDQKAEVEQAVGIHWLLTIYAGHGDAWRDVAMEEIKHLRENLPKPTET